MSRSIAGASVDESYLRRLDEEGKRRHGDKWSSEDLRAASQFAPYWHTGTRLKVRRVYAWSGETFERTGTVGTTTGWKPAFLLMHRSSDHGSWDVLGADDEIVAVWNGRRYEEVAPA